jgi:hypothetical protein
MTSKTGPNISSLPALVYHKAVNMPDSSNAPVASHSGSSFDDGRTHEVTIRILVDLTPATIEMNLCTLFLSGGNQPCNPYFGGGRD